MKPTQTKEKKIWFPAKRHGWGWGLPVAWQGWLVLLPYVAGLVACSLFIPPSMKPFDYAISVAAMTAVLVAICWLKGERPGWRWRGDR